MTGWTKMSEDLERARHLAEIALEFLHQIHHEVGMLDEQYESPLIDSRIEVGAYQYIGKAINRVEEYIWDIKEVEKNGQ